MNINRIFLLVVFLLGLLVHSLQDEKKEAIAILKRINKQRVCIECKGTGEVRTDEDDGEGHIMRGVGTEKCICQQN